MGKRRAVRKGQHYREARQRFLGQTSPTWTVEEMFTSTDGLEYARLVCGSDPSLQKTISTAVLADKRRFLCVDD